MNNAKSILWQRLDRRGHEFATIVPDSLGWVINGVAVFVEVGDPCRMEYEIRCDRQWTTRECVLRGSIGAKPVHMEIKRSPDAVWSIDGMNVDAVRGCNDIDLEFSPATNLLPIRRLALPVGAQANVRAAWIRFPALTLEVLEQSYARVARDRYHYESAGGSFQRELAVDEFGCVVDYPGLWRVEATTTFGVLDSRMDA